MFKYNIEKIANTILYFTEKDVQHLGKTKLMKLMFFADKLHLEKYGRVIFFDEYYKYPRGPVANITLNIINSINEVEKDDLEEYTNKFLKYLEVRTIKDNNDNITSFKPKVDFNKKFFSKSEIKILHTISNRFISHTKEEISDESHNLKEYKKTKLMDKIQEIEMIESKDMKEYYLFIQNDNDSFNRNISA